MANKALVLGGGGPLGIAWEIGVAAGLASEGVDVANADFILGTSAGSVVGSQLAAGKSAQELAEGQLAFSRMMAATNPTPPPPPDLSRLMSFMLRLPPTGEPDIALRKEIGEFSRGATTISEDQFLGQMSAIGVPASWPDRFACTAVDAESGEFHVWRKADGVETLRGVASSCSVPGIYPPISLKGRRWMDGGMRSATCVDMAAGHERVLVMAVIPSALVEDRMRGRLEHEAGAVIRAGGRVEYLTPDAATQAAFGPNLMDGTRRSPVVETGIAQGKREAARIKAFWS